MSDILEQLSETLRARRSADPRSSYVADLYQQGVDAILKKIGEEATETVLAAKGGDRKQLIHEMADLWFHTLVLLAHEGLAPADVLSELEHRMGRSGIEEKAARDKR